MFKTFVAHPRILDDELSFFSETERTATNHNFLGAIFAMDLDLLQVAAKNRDSVA